jgi:hypothetical protein
MFVTFLWYDKLEIQCDSVQKRTMPGPPIEVFEISFLDPNRNRPVYRLMAGLPDSGSTSSAMSLKRCILTGRLQAVGAGWMGFV